MTDPSLTQQARVQRFHRLKLDEKYFAAIHSGAKKAEFRRADRDYRVGDYLLMEHLLVRVTHILTHADFDAIPEDYCILSFQYPAHD